MPPGVKYIIISTIFFALMNVGVKYLTAIPAHEIVLFRGLVSLIVCYLMLRRLKISLWGNNKRLLIYRGLAGTAGLIMYFYTVQNMPLASAVTIQYMSPIFTIILAGIMRQESPRPIQWLFFIVSFAGVVMIKGFDPRVDVMELVIGVSSAFFSGLAYNFIRKLKDYDQPLVVVFYFPMVTVPIIGTYTIFHWVTPNLEELIVLILIGLVTTAAQIDMTKAYQVDKASNISNFNYLGSIYAIVIGLLFFDETIGALAMAGIGLIIFGVYMSSRFRQA